MILTFIRPVELAMNNRKRRWNYAPDEDTKIKVRKARELCYASCRCMSVFEDDAWAFSARSLYEAKERVKNEFGGKWNPHHPAWIVRAGSEAEVEKIRESLQIGIDSIIEEYRAKKRAKDAKVIDAKRSEAAKKAHARRREALLLKNGYCADLKCAGGRQCKDPSHYTTLD
jgi:hypothetical protein